MRHLKGLAKGDRAPSFAIKDQEGNEILSSQFRGKRMLLSFHPLAWTAICAKQMESLETHSKTFASLDTVALGVSVDSVPSKKAWAESLGIVRTKLLCDFWPHGAVSRAYGNFIEKLGFSGRANIIVDGNGTIIFANVYEIKQLPDIHEIIDFLKKQA